MNSHGLVLSTRGPMMKRRWVISAVLLLALLFSTPAMVPRPSMAQQQLPDLIILRAWRSDSQICYSIKNIGQGSVGGGAAPASHYSVLFIDGKQVAEDKITTPLAPGQQLDRCFSYQFQMTPPQHTIRVCADWRQNIKESNEGNNCWEQVWVMEEKLPDLVVERIECVPGNKLSVTIKNIGSGALPSGWKALADTYFDGKRMGAFDLTYPTSILNGGIEKPGGSSAYLPGWDVTVPVTVRVIADFTDDIRESNEQNNSKQERIEPLVTKLPDLIIDRINCDRENSRIGYVIKNTGEAAAPPGHATVLFVDGKAVCKDIVDLELAPGETHESWFGCYT